VPGLMAGINAALWARWEKTQVSESRPGAPDSVAGPETFTLDRTEGIRGF